MGYSIIKFLRDDETYLVDMSQWVYSGGIHLILHTVSIHVLVS